MRNLLQTPLDMPNDVANEMHSDEGKKNVSDLWSLRTYFGPFRIMVIMDETVVRVVKLVVIVLEEVIPQK